MARVVRVQARGRVEVPAYGIADAEHLVEKEMSRLWPGAQLRIESVTRLGPTRIVEEFAVDYLVSGDVEVDGEGEAERRARAFAAVRTKLAASRYGRAGLEEEGVGSQKSEVRRTDN